MYYIIQKNGCFFVSDIKSFGSNLVGRNTVLFLYSTGKMGRIYTKKCIKFCMCRNSNYRNLNKSLYIIQKYGCFSVRICIESMSILKFLSETSFSYVKVYTSN